MGGSGWAKEEEEQGQLKQTKQIKVMRGRSFSCANKNEADGRGEEKCD